MKKRIRTKYNREYRKKNHIKLLSYHNEYRKRVKKYASYSYRKEKLARYYKKNKKKILARQKVYLAIKRGFIKRGICEVCGKINADAHHKNYDNPMDIKWLCRIHHKIEHGLLIGRCGIDKPKQ